MEHRLSDYAQIRKYKTGRYSIKCTVENEVSIYKMLYAKGFRRVVYTGKASYWLCIENTTVPATLEDIRKSFITFLTETEFMDIVDERDRKETINWFWGQKNRIRENDLFK